MTTAAAERVSSRRSHALRDGCFAGAVAALASGAPSTLHALTTRRDPLESTIAAGTLVLPRAHRRTQLVAGGLLHVAISTAWALVLAALLPRRRTVAAGALAGLAIAALDLGLIGRRRASIRALPALPQLADHLAYGAIVGAVVARRRTAGMRPTG